MTRERWLSGAALTALGFTAPAWAQDGNHESISIFTADTQREDVILVSGDREPGGVAVYDYPGTATIIDKEEVEQRQVRDVADVLRDVPGVAVGSVPGQTQLRLRGSEANHVLVLIDGIEVSDPFAGEFDLSALQAEIGSFVEVLRGPQSALYGSDAIGGVVAYRSGYFNGLNVRAEGGTNNTINGAARLGLGSQDTHLSLSANVVSTDGEPNARDGSRDIGRDSYSLSGIGRLAVADNVFLRAVGRYLFTEGAFNDQDFDPASPTFGFVVDSPDTRFENEAFYGLVGADLKLFDDLWSHDLSVQIADIRRDSFGPFGRSFGSEGERLKASYVSSIKLGGFGSEHTFTAAADWEEERYRNTDPFGFAFTGTRTNENIGLVGEYRYFSEGLRLSAAIRHDSNDNFADATTFKLAGAVNMTDATSLRASIGSGIKNPGFYELFGFIDGRFIGNEDLRPEKSTGWEVGIDQGIPGSDIEVSLTWFDSTLENEIFTSFPAPDFVATPANAATDSDRRGLEAALSALIGESWSVDAAYTWLDAEENGVTEVRRPRHVASAAITWTAPRDKASASLVVRHNGSAQDLAFTDPSFVPVRVTLDDFTLVNLYGEIELAEGLGLFGRVENLLNERYEQVFSFVSPGRHAVAGFKATF
ncbi:MAG: TonB-dependent receptor plug domain-containing protein [Erythrobacter sp.]